MTLPSPLTLAAARYLKDGEWHPKDKVLDAMQASIAFGTAEKWVEKKRRPLLSPETRVVTGKELMSKRQLALLIANGRFEEKIEGGILYVRDVESRHSTVRPVAEMLGRSPSTIHNWSTQPQILAEIQRLCPDGIPPIRPIRGSWMIPDEAVPAWREFSASRVNLQPVNHKAILDVVSRVFNLDPPEAQEKLDTLRQALWKKGYSILRRQLVAEQKNAKKLPTGNDADAPPQQGADN